jgi:D-alanyl-D-alanine carboxypeptidase
MTNLQMRMAGVLGLGCVMAAALPMGAQSSLPGATASGIDAAAADVLKATGVPSASVAVVQSGKVA